MLGWWVNARCCLRHSAAPIPRLRLAYPCFKNLPQRDKLADCGISHQGFCHNLVTSFSHNLLTQYWDPSAWTLVPRALHFSITSGFFLKNELALVLLFSMNFCPYSICRRWGIWICCNFNTVHKEVTDVLYQPVSHFYCSASFSAPSNPSSSHLSLETAGRSMHKCFVSKHISNWNVIVQPLCLASLFFSVCT